MSYQPEPEKSADPNAQHSSQPLAFQTEPPPSQYPPPGQYVYPVPGQYPPPGPPTAQYEQKATMAVVTAQPTPVARRYQTAPPDYLTLTLVGMVVCCICGGVIGVVVFVPAFICSIMASNANSSGDYDTARKLGNASLAWNIFSYIFATLAIVAVVVAVVVVQTSSGVTCRVNGFGSTVCS